MHILQSCRSSHPEVFCKKVISEISQNSQQNTCDRVSFLVKLEACARVSFLKLQASGLQPYEKETLAQVFSCEFCEISKNTFSYRAPSVEKKKKKKKNCVLLGYKSEKVNWDPFFKYFIKSFFLYKRLCCNDSMPNSQQRFSFGVSHIVPIIASAVLY